jgi:hypothetical protein
MFYITYFLRYSIIYEYLVTSASVLVASVCENIEPSMWLDLLHIMGGGYKLLSGVKYI